MSRPLHVVHVIPQLCKGGAERLMLDIAQQMRQRGHRVSIVTFREGNAYEGLSKGLGITTVKARADFSWRKENASDSEAFDRLMEQLQPDIIHSHLIEAEIVTRQHPLPGVAYLSHWHSCHRLPTNKPRGREWLTRDGWWRYGLSRWIKRQYLRCDNHFICISAFIRQHLIDELGIAPDRLHTILNGCDLARFAPMPKVAHTGRTVIASLGAFRKEKNLGFLMQVLHQLHGMGHTDIELLMIGDGEMRPMLEQEAGRLGVSHSVRFTGYADHPSEYLAEADMLVHSAIGEPFGLVALEAMCSRLPVVAFRSGGIPEVIEHGRTGLLCQAGNLEAFCHNIIRLKERPDQAAAMGLAGSEAVKAFDIKLCADRVEELYFSRIENIA